MYLFFLLEAEDLKLKAKEKLGVVDLKREVEGLKLKAEDLKLEVEDV